MEKITYEQAKKAKETLIIYLKGVYDGYDGEHTYTCHKEKYLLLCALLMERNL